MGTGKVVLFVVTLITMETPVPTSADTSERRLSVLRTRRDWSPAEKRAIVAETHVPGANVSAISRRHGAAQSMIYQWRKAFGPAEATATGPMPAFLPVAIAAPSAHALPAEAPATPAPVAPVSGGMIEIVLANGRRVRAEASADPLTLARLVAALEGGA